MRRLRDHGGKLSAQRVEIGPDAEIRRAWSCLYGRLFHEISWPQNHFKLDLSWPAALPQARATLDAQLVRDDLRVVL